ncbi:MAG: S8 family serine peptidase [Dehalococcoidia bacterium]
MVMRPAWSWQFDEEHLKVPVTQALLDEITSEWACAGSTGAGVRVAIIDSGVEQNHPAVQGAVHGWVEPIEGPNGYTFNEAPHTDAYGHGTALAGIIHGLAPDAQIYSVKVLGAGLTGRAQTLAAGLRWAIDHDMHVANLSLGLTKREYYGLFHELADDAYFHNLILVTAANNMPVPTYPAQYASVVSVASQIDLNPEHFAYNPSPPVDFGAPGINVRVAWLQGGYITATGNSYAAPHMTGHVCRVLSKHPGLVPYQVKTILRSMSSNMQRQITEDAETAERSGIR